MLHARTKYSVGVAAWRSLHGSQSIGGDRLAGSVYYSNSGWLERKCQIEWAKLRVP